MKNKALKRLIYALPLLGAGILLFSPTSASSILTPSVKNDTVINTGYKLRTIVIDAGHGVKPNPPGPGKFSVGSSGIYSTERGVTLMVAQKLQKAIEKDIEGVNVVMTRKTETDVSLQRRPEIANENKGDLFISIHCNALPNKTIRERVGTKKGRAVYSTRSVIDRSGKGVLMLVYGLKRSGEQQKEIKSNQVSQMDDEADPNDPITIILTNEYLRRFRQKSITLANILADEFVSVDGRRLEGIREQSLNVLVHAAMPSVLIEIGYITNLEEEDYLNSEKGQEEIVASILRAIKSYKLQVEQTVIRN
ncbi:N-acetylmuramoyl-L-alanine amidase [Mucilaginibacter calamicampi]|uniref:N-acetylmuramoyl-L-alanine amidase n=1 Tax=Mucilaginibacter calamicampi TaxID=1302352 RepID=A0ABW2YYP3_9SPHI